MIQLLTKLTLITLLSFPVMKETSAGQIDITFQESQLSSYQKNDLLYKGIDEPLLNPEVSAKIIEDINKKVSVPPRDSYLDENNQIIQHENGYTLHEKKFNNLLLEALLSKGSTSIEVPLKVIYPRVDSELLSSIRTKQIGQYVTYFNRHNMERSHNIALAANEINNTVVFPGEVFSFNKVVGKRTKDKGYKKAPVIVRGELSEDIGGGICQVSSTLYNAVDLAGVKIVELFHHSKRVPYVPHGRDATVSWYGPDFVFATFIISPS
ncbi:VanW family protein [Bacillus sp. Marseille-Q1617]|uniref:VanW family protein n=1 Tax=Bacillus sp. Marseille-Q1617 TaxID=2736887 RepID=UPI0020CA44C3|nr:VanW family protein [Bacillus sp. Marseille-Q1617]